MTRFYSFLTFVVLITTLNDGDLIQAIHTLSLGLFILLAIPDVKSPKHTAKEIYKKMSEMTQAYIEIQKLNKHYGRNQRKYFKA